MELRGYIGALAILLGGCGYSVDSSTPSSGAPIVAPVIITQPASQSVPMGLPATYSVQAAGTTPQYQWSRNGTVIAGATGSSYVSPPVSFADTGASFAVVISNSVGTVTSNTVTLTVTARAPSAGDLRFHQVDSAATVNGYGGGSYVTATLKGFAAETYASTVGSPLWVGLAADCTPSSGGTVADCSWAYVSVPLPVADSALTAGFGSDSFANLDFDLVDPNWPNAGSGTSPADSKAVITSLDLEPDSQLFAVAWVQDASNQQSAFSAAMHTVSLADLPTAASADGAISRVITAVSANASAGELTYVSYAWSADTATVYETQVSTTPAGEAAAAAAALATSGYIITAIGRADDAGDVVLVGTRRQGDTMSRPFVTAQSSGAFQTFMADGYATVGVITGSVPNTAQAYLGER